MSRVNLVSDMFALAEVGKLPYQILFSTMKYLPHEISDYPLMLALNEFNKIRSTLFGSIALEPYKVSFFLFRMMSNDFHNAIFRNRSMLTILVS